MYGRMEASCITMHIIYNWLSAAAGMQLCGQGAGDTAAARARGSGVLGVSDNPTRTQIHTCTAKGCTVGAQLCGQGARSTVAAGAGGSGAAE